MLGEPMTPLFCIAAFRSSEANQVRAFATSATSWRMTTSFWSSALRNTRPLAKARDFEKETNHGCCRVPFVQAVPFAQAMGTSRKWEGSLPYRERLSGETVLV